MKVRWGMLLHERFKNKDAVGLFQEALQRDPTTRGLISAWPSLAPTDSIVKRLTMSPKP